MDVISNLIVVLLVIVIIALVVMNIRIVPQAKAYVIERLGAYRETWQRLCPLT